MVDNPLDYVAKLEEQRSEWRPGYEFSQGVAVTRRTITPEQMVGAIREVVAARRLPFSLRLRSDLPPTQHPDLDAGVYLVEARYVSAAAAAT